MRVACGCAGVKAPYFEEEPRVGGPRPGIGLTWVRRDASRCQLHGPTGPTGEVIYGTMRVPGIAFQVEARAGDAVILRLGERLPPDRMQRLADEWKRFTSTKAVILDPSVAVAGVIRRREPLLRRLARRLGWAT